MKHLCWAAAAALAALSLGAGARAGGDKQDAAKKELKALEGNWQLTRQEERGFLTPRPVVARLRVVIEGDQMEWYIGNPAPNQAATLTLDPTKTPKAIDAEVTRGSANGRKMLGIYRLNGNTLEICWNEAGNPKRPKKFSSRPGVGSGNVYTKYEREKEDKGGNEEVNGPADRPGAPLARPGRPAARLQSSPTRRRAEAEAAGRGGHNGPTP